MTADAPTPSVLCVRQVTRTYPGYGGSASFALQQTSLEIRRGDWVAITGRSGAGKTTLLHVLSGLDRPDSGTVCMFGQDLAKCSQAAIADIRRQRLGIVYQRYFFLEHLPVWQNISCRLVPAGVPAKLRRRRAEELLAQVGLAGAADRFPRDLSGGEQQRVALARALVAEPGVIIADEPTSNVDAETGEVLIQHLQRRRENGVAVVTATHDAALIAHANVHYVMDNGSMRKQ